MCVCVCVCVFSSVCWVERAVMLFLLTGDIPDRVWTGGNDLVFEGEWKWIGSGENMDYTDWYPGKYLLGFCLLFFCLLYWFILLLLLLLFLGFFGVFVVVVLLLLFWGLWSEM